MERQESGSTWDVGVSAATAARILEAMDVVGAERGLAWPEGEPSRTKVLADWEGESPGAADDVFAKAAALGEANSEAKLEATQDWTQARRAEARIADVGYGASVFLMGVTAGLGAGGLVREATAAAIASGVAWLAAHGWKAARSARGGTLDEVAVAAGERAESEMLQRLHEKARGTQAQAS